MARATAGPGRAALAYAGMVALYLPLLTLFLPLRVAAVAGGGRVGLLALLSIVGAVVAGGTNLLFGWASDRGRRRTWIAGGLGATLGGYLLLGLARGPAELVGAVALFQGGLNAALAPLLALVAEEVPDARKGLMTGLMAGANPFGYLLGPALVWSLGVRLGPLLVAEGGIAVLCVLPLLWSRAPLPTAPVPAAPIPTARRTAAPAPAGRADLLLTTVARLLVQMATSVLFGFLLFLVEPVLPTADPAAAAVRVGGLLLVANLLPWPVALALGRWSDRVGRRKPFLLAGAGVAAAGLAIMAAGGAWPAAAAGFALFAVGANTFLALQVGLAMEVLPDPAHRGRDLGFLNLANTGPALLGPALAWALARPAPLLFLLAAFTVAGGLLTLVVRGRR